MAAGHGWGGVSRTGFQPPRAGLRHRFPSLSKEGSVFLCRCVIESADSTKPPGGVSS
jgi:hypothetical protein